MRDIKFRGKRLDNGEWAKGQYLYDDVTGKGWSVLSINESQTTEGGLFVYCVEVDPSTVGQYTGLPDKNGKEIYEGDICRHQAYVNWGKLSEHTGAVSISPNNGVMIGHNSAGTEIKLLGNIHDNPELLTGQV
jgi:uncharacterized phage protein (TIGR01671 family)